MARYIDADKLENWVNAFHPADAYWAIPMLRNAPTADVVPKREADMLHHLLNDAWKSIEEFGNLCGELQKAKDEVAREILSDLKKEVHNKATYTHARDTYSFINLNTFDQIVTEMIRRCENYGNQEA